MILAITGAETADQLIKQLVYLRHSTRRIIKGLEAIGQSRAHFERCRDNAADGAMKAEAMAELANLDERQLMLRSTEIEVGQYLSRCVKPLTKRRHANRSSMRSTPTQPTGTPTWCGSTARRVTA